MKKFLLRFILFMVPVVILSIPLDKFLSVQLCKSKDYAHGEFSVWNDLYQGNAGSDILVYGSSRAWVHISPDIISNGTGLTAYNLGIDGHNFWLQYLRHDLLLKYNKVPKQIIFSLDIFTLQKKHELYNFDQFLPYMFFNAHLKSYLDSYEGYSFFDYYIPLVRYYGKSNAIKRAIQNAIIPLIQDTGRTRGYQGMNVEWNNDFDLAKKSMEYYEIKTDSFTIALFDRFLKECEQKNIEVTLVYTPEYIEGQKFVKNRSEIIELYKQIASKHGIAFLDYTDDEICKNIDCFYNASHMKIAGAELFTSKMVSDMKRLNLIVGSRSAKIISGKPKSE